MKNAYIITFEQFATHTRALAEQIRASGFQPAMIIAIARGGWDPGAIAVHVSGREKTG